MSRSSRCRVLEGRVYSWSAYLPGAVPAVSHTELSPAPGELLRWQPPSPRCSRTSVALCSSLLRFYITPDADHLRVECLQRQEAEVLGFPHHSWLSEGPG